MGKGRTFAERKATLGPRTRGRGEGTHFRGAKGGTRSADAGAWGSGTCTIVLTLRAITLVTKDFAPTRRFVITLRDGLRGL